MSTNSLEHIAALFDAIGFKSQRVEERIVATIVFDDVEAKLLVSLLAADKIVNFELLGLISTQQIQSSDHMARFIQYLLAQNWATTCGSVEMDTDGEVRVVMEVPMADAVMTAEQMKLVIASLAHQAELLLTKGRNILRTGKVEAPSEAAPGGEASSGQMGEILIAFMQMSQSEEGRARLRGFESDAQTPEALRVLARKILAMAGPVEL